MDAILENMLMFEYNDEENEKDYEDDSIWIKDDDIYRGSNDVKITNSIKPGMYIADLNKDYGLFCRKLNSTNDELFKFTDNTINSLIEEIQSFWKKKDLYKEHKLIHKRGILMYGFPGTGKTSTISLLADDLIKQGGVVFKVQSPEDLTTHINFIKYSFRKIQPDTPIITILEDVNKYDDMEVELLDFLDGKNQINHHVVIMTTNDTSNIPNNLLRPSRIDLKIEIALPDNKIRKEFLEFKKVPKEDIDELVNVTNGFSIADLKELFISRYLLNYNIEESISKIKNKFNKKSFMDNPLGTSELGI